MDAAADQCTFVAQQDVAIVKPAYVPVAKQVGRRQEGAVRACVCWCGMCVLKNETKARPDDAVCVCVCVCVCTAWWWLGLGDVVCARALQPCPETQSTRAGRHLRPHLALNPTRYTRTHGGHRCARGC